MVPIFVNFVSFGPNFFKMFKMILSFVNYGQFGSFYIYAS